MINLKSYAYCHSNEFIYIFHFRLVDASVNVVLGPSTGPEVMLYKKMMEKWNDIDTTRIEHLRRKPEHNELVQFGKGYIENTNDRGDYMELLSLALLLLGEHPSEKYHVRSIGAVTNAR